jgi:hypothetical protein
MESNVPVDCNRKGHLNLPPFMKRKVVGLWSPSNALAERRKHQG